VPDGHAPPTDVTARPPRPPPRSAQPTRAAHRAVPPCRRYARLALQQAFREREADRRASAVAGLTAQPTPPPPDGFFNINHPQRSTRSRLPPLTPTRPPHLTPLRAGLACPRTTDASAAPPSSSKTERKREASGMELTLATLRHAAPASGDMAGNFTLASSVRRAADRKTARTDPHLDGTSPRHTGRCLEEERNARQEDPGTCSPRGRLRAGASSSTHPGRRSTTAYTRSTHDRACAHVDVVQRSAPAAQHESKPYAHHDAALLSRRPRPGSVTTLHTEIVTHVPLR
jgi:hypothetical protein